MSLTKDVLVVCHCHEQTVFAHFGAVGCYVAYCYFQLSCAVCTEHTAIVYVIQVLKQWSLM